MTQREQKDLEELNDHVAFLTGRIKLLETRWAEVCKAIGQGHRVSAFRMRGSDRYLMAVGWDIYG